VIAGLPSLILLVSVQHLPGTHVRCVALMEMSDTPLQCYGCIPTSGN
jgi:hypothetical protein